MGTNVDLTHDQTRTIARTIQRRNVEVWLEMNAPWDTLGRMFSDEHFYNEPDAPNGRQLRPGPVDETLLSHLLRTIEHWQHISSGAVITSQHGAAMEQTYPALQAAFPDFCITGGLKVWPYIEWPSPSYGADKGLDWLADFRVWEQFATDARMVVEMTGVQDVFVMAESPMTPFNSGWRDEHGKRVYYHPDYSKFSEAMAPLRELTEDGIGITWYPVGTYRGRSIHESARLVAMIRAVVPGSRFSMVGEGWPKNVRDPEAMRHRNAQQAVTGGHFSHLLFVAAGGEYQHQGGRRQACYTPETLQPWLLNESSSDHVTIYPGFFNGLGCGKAMVELLIPEAFRPQQEEPPEKDEGDLDPPNSSPTELEPTTIP